MGPDSRVEEDAQAKFVGISSRCRSAPICLKDYSIGLSLSAGSAAKVRVELPARVTISRASLGNSLQRYPRYDEPLSYPLDLYGGYLIKDFAERLNLACIDSNLIHKENAELGRTYLDYVESLLEIQSAQREFSALCPSGTTAVWAAIDCAHQYQSLLGSGRAGVVCSVGAHSSVKDRFGMPVYCASLDSNTSQPVVAELLSLLTTKRPAALLLTVGRTDDGVIEEIDPEVAKVCRELQIPIIVDLSAGSIFPFLPDVPLCADDCAPKQKQSYRQVLAEKSVKFVVAGWGKFLGPFGLGSVYLVHADECSELQAAAQKTFYPSGSGYFAAGKLGYYGATTINSRPAEQAVQLMSRLGVNGLRVLALQARRVALEVSNELRKAGVKTAPVRSQCIVIPLSSHAQAEEVQSKLLKKFDLKVATLKSCGSGIRIVLNLGRIFSPYDCKVLHAALCDVLLDETGLNHAREAVQESTFKSDFWPSLVCFVNRYVITPELARNVGKLYGESDVVEKLGVKSPALVAARDYSIGLPELVNKVIDTLGILTCKHAESLSGIGHALEELGRASQFERAPAKELATLNMRARDFLINRKHFCGNIRVKDSETRHWLKVTDDFVRELGNFTKHELSFFNQFCRFVTNRTRFDLSELEKMLEDFLSKTRELRDDWNSRLLPIPSID